MATGWLAVFPRCPQLAEALLNAPIILMFISITAIPRCTQLAETLLNAPLILMFTSLTAITQLAEALLNAPLLLILTSLTAITLSTSAFFVFLPAICLSGINCADWVRTMMRSLEQPHRTPRHERQFVRVSYGLHWQWVRVSVFPLVLRRVITEYLVRSLSRL
jgi:hypothetical protein